MCYWIGFIQLCIGFETYQNRTSILIIWHPNGSNATEHIISSCLSFEQKAETTTKAMAIKYSRRREHIHFHWGRQLMWWSRLNKEEGGSAPVWCGRCNRGIGKGPITPILDFKFETELYIDYLAPKRFKCYWTHNQLLFVLWTKSGNNDEGNGNKI